MIYYNELTFIYDGEADSSFLSQEKESMENMTRRMKMLLFQISFLIMSSCMIRSNPFFWHEK